MRAALTLPEKKEKGNSQQQARRHSVEIIEDQLSGNEIISLLTEHLSEMRAVSPPESAHALSIEQLKEASVTFWSAWERGVLLGCGALKELDEHHGEIKSMRTTTTARRSGIASKLLQHLITEATQRNYKTLSLETGAMPHFDPARHLYLKHGFTYCKPFGTYTLDPNSVFMSKRL